MHRPPSSLFPRSLFPLGLALACASASGAHAQVPGLPVLQNAFVSPGLAIAANAGGAEGGSGFYGAAVGWGLGSRFQASAAAGAQRSRSATRGAYGGRVAANLWTTRSQSFGAGAFVGVGGAPSTSDGTETVNPAIMTVPAGVSVAYQRPIGASRGFSVFAAPFYSWTRADSVAVTSGGAFRVSAGVDFAFSRSLGVTVGGEFGGDGEGSSNAFAGALTYVLGRR